MFCLLSFNRHLLNDYCVLGTMDKLVNIMGMTPHPMELIISWETCNIIMCIHIHNMHTLVTNNKCLCVCVCVCVY